MASKINIFNSDDISGLYFYDLKTNKPISSPKVTTGTSYLQSSARLPIIGEPCMCANLNCGCCAGLNIQQFNFNQKCKLLQSFFKW